MPLLFFVSGCGLFGEEGKSESEISPFYWSGERSFPEAALSIWISEEDHIYIGGEEGWYLSTNYGNSFKKYQIPEEVLSFKVKKFGQMLYGYGQVISDIHVINGDTTDAGFWGGSYNLYSSMDGDNWQKISGPFPIYDMMEYDGNIYLGKEHGVVTHNMASGEEFATDFLFIDASNWIDEIQVNSKGEIFAGTMDGIYLSKDKGQSWVNVTADILNSKKHSENHVEKIIVDGDELYGVGGSLSYSDDAGESWRILDYKLKNYEGEIVNHFMTDFAIAEDGYMYSINYLGFFMYGERNAEYFEFFGPEKYSSESEFPLDYEEVHSFKNGGVMITTVDNYFFYIGQRNESSNFWD